MTQDVPDKIYFSIREVAAIADVPHHVLRFWERRFPRLSPRRSRGGHRRYTKKDVELILEIKSLVQERGFTTKGAEKFLRAGSQEPESPSQDLGWLKRELSDIIALLKSA